MKSFLLLIFITSISLRLFADPGNAYRYKASFNLSDGREITGFFYFATYEKGFNEKETDFKDYIFSYYNFPVIIYENIKTIDITADLTVDFALAGSGIPVNKDEIVSIKLLNEISTQVGSRLVELSPGELELLNHDFISTESFYNEQMAISCTFYLLNWDAKNNLPELKEEISDHLEKLVNEGQSQSFNEYFEQIKMELAGKKILLFKFCGPV